MSIIDPTSNRMASQRLVFLALAIAVFAGAASMRILDALLPDIAHQYKLSIGTASLAVSAYALSYSGFQLAYGPLGDRLGPYRVILWAAALSAVAALACALAPSIGWLILCRFVAGGVAAAIGPLALTWVGHATLLVERPVVIARMSSASILGTTAGQVCSGLLGQFSAWRSSFLLTSVLFAGAALMLARAGARRTDVHTIGRVHSSSQPGSRFYDLLMRPAMRSTLIWVGLEGFGIYMSLTYATVMLKRQLSIGIGNSGLIVSFFGVGGLIFAVFAQRVINSCLSHLRALLGGGLAASGLALIIFAQNSVFAAMCMCCTGFGVFCLHNILQVRATHMAPDAPATAISLFAATFFLAQAVGSTLGGWMIDHSDPWLSWMASAAVLLGIGIAISLDDKAGLALQKLKG